MAKKIKGPWNTHIRRDYPDQSFFESKIDYRKRKKREKELAAFLKQTGRVANKLHKLATKPSKKPTRGYSQSRTNKILKEQEKSRLIEAAKTEHSEFLSWIDQLTNILLEREKEDFDWNFISASQGEYKRRDFQPSHPFLPPKEPTEKSVRLEIEGRHSIILIIIALFLISACGFFFKIWVGLLGIVLCIVLYVFDQRRLNKICASELPMALRRANEQYRKDLQAATLKHQNLLDKEREEHNSKEEENKQEWENEEENRRRIRDSITNNDLEVLQNILAEELSGLVLPVEQELCLSFHDAHSVEIFFQLPDLGQVPERDLSLTKTGKLSEKTMTQKKRISIFTNLCTGIALRLAYESFRVINSLTDVQIIGYSSSVDPATGKEDEIYSLFIEIDKTELIELDLDRVVPSEAFEHLGGVFGCDRKGCFSQVPVFE